MKNTKKRLYSQSRVVKATFTSCNITKHSGLNTIANLMNHKKMQNSSIKNVLAFNLTVMMRQNRIKFKKQEHRTFIDWFIAAPAKITSSGHQIELKMYEHHFYKADQEEHDRLIEAA